MAGRKLLQSFYDQGYVVVDGLKSVEEARQAIEDVIAAIDPSVLPLYKRYSRRVTFLKLGAMPVADDIENAFQGLHFDMGHPFVRKQQPTIYLLTGLFVPPKASASDGKTRVVTIAGLLHKKKMRAGIIEKKLMQYANDFGDGWSSKRLGNTGRLCCFAKALDALGEKRTLPDYIDWFYDRTIDERSQNRRKELAFYKRHGIDLLPLEQLIALSPSQMLLLDNTRVIHSRFGKRPEKQMWQFLYGVQSVQAGDMPTLRKFVVNQLAYGS